MADRHLHGYNPTKALAEEVGLLDLEVFHKSTDVVGLLLATQRAIDVSRTSVPLHLDRNRLPIPSQRGKHVRQPRKAVNRDQPPRRDLAVDPERHVQAVHWSLA